MRKLRLARALTLQQLSERSGLAASTLSKIEQSKISSSYENILALAYGLNIEVAELMLAELPPNASGRRSVTRAGQGQRIQVSQYDIEILAADFSRKHFAPFLTTIKAQSLKALPPLLSHDGEEFIHILAGEVEVITEYYESLRLSKGDSCYFDSRMGHTCLATGPADATVLWVCSRFSTAMLDELDLSAVDPKSP